MARISEHMIDRTLTSYLPESIGQINNLDQALTLSEILLIDNYLPENCKEIMEFNKSMSDAKKVLLRFNTTFIPDISFHNPPYFKDAIKCASYFLNFHVTSKKDIRRIFGDKIIEEIAKNLGILTFKDNLNPKSSDKILLFNLALIYCVNTIQSNNKEISIPFNIFDEKFFSIQFDKDYSAYLFNAIKSINSFSITHSPFSSTFNILYRAYETYVISSNVIIELLVKTRKNYSQKNKKYCGETIEELERQKKAIKTAQWKLMSYIKNNIVEWLEQDEQRHIEQEIEESNQETINLLTEIYCDFKRRKFKNTLSFDYLLCVLTHMNSDNDIDLYVSTIKYLVTMTDDFMFKEFKKIIFHLLKKNKFSMPTANINSIIKHLNKTSISDDCIYTLADCLYSISDISNEEYLLFDSILYSVNNNHEMFIVVHNLLMAYTNNPFL